MARLLEQYLQISPTFEWVAKATVIIIRILTHLSLPVRARHARRDGCWRGSMRPDAHGKSGSETGSTIWVGPRLRAALEVRRREAMRVDVGFSSFARGEFSLKTA
jgi:hypothetical protein